MFGDHTANSAQHRFKFAAGSMPFVDEPNLNWLQDLIEKGISNGYCTGSEFDLLDQLLVMETLNDIPYL
jgi:hypothetical protein